MNTIRLTRAFPGVLTQANTPTVLSEILVWQVPPRWVVTLAHWTPVLLKLRTNVPADIADDSIVQVAARTPASLTGQLAVLWESPYVNWSGLNIGDQQNSENQGGIRIELSSDYAKFGAAVLDEEDFLVLRLLTAADVVDWTQSTIVLPLTRTTKRS